MGINYLNKAIFLDRDGVLNHSIIRNSLPYSPISLSEIEFCQESIQPLKILKGMGYFLIGITNQPEVSRGNLSLDIAKKINTTIKNKFLLDELYSCFHDSGDHCDCRKPKSGNFLLAQIKFGIDFNKSFMIGDRYKDIEAGNNLGIKSLFIDYNYNEKKPNLFFTKKNSLKEIFIFLIDHIKNINND